MTILHMIALTFIFTTLFLLLILLVRKGYMVKEFFSYLRPDTDDIPPQLANLKQFTRFYKHTLAAGNHVSFFATVDDNGLTHISGTFLGETEGGMLIIDLGEREVAELNKNQMGPSSLTELNGVPTSSCGRF